jgi:hypothetical protein
LGTTAFCGSLTRPTIEALAAVCEYPTAAQSRTVRRVKLKIQNRFDMAFSLEIRPEPRTTFMNGKRSTVQKYLFASKQC